MAPKIPIDLTVNAYRSADGNYAWKRPEALRVIHELLAQELAPVLVEAWVAPDFEPYIGTHSHVIPQADNKAEIFRWDWLESWNEDVEQWGIYCRRAGEEALAYIDKVKPDETALEIYRPIIYFHVLFLSREDFSDE